MKYTKRFETNPVQDNGTCPHDGSKLDVEYEHKQKWLELHLYCIKCDYEATCSLPWVEFQEEPAND